MRVRSSWAILMIVGLVGIVAGCGGSEPGIVDPTSIPGSAEILASPTPVGLASEDATPSPVRSEAPTPEPDAADAPDLPSRSSSAVAVSPDGTLVIAVNPDSNSVTVIDAANLEVIGEAAVGRDPRTVAFVANHGSGTVTRIDVRSASADREWPVGPAPYMHDGSAPTSRAVFEVGTSHDPAHAVAGRIGEEEMKTLGAFLRAL